MSQTPERKSEKRRQELVKKQDDLYDRIAIRAYELYAERGYQHGNDLDDWLKAERAVLRELHVG